MPEVYVFCLLAHRDKVTVDPLDLDQWRFFVESTAKLDRELGGQQKMALCTLMALEPREVGYGELGEAVEEAGAPK